MRFCIWAAMVLLLGKENVSGQSPQLILQKGHLKRIKSVSFSKNGKYILTAGEDHTAKIWDPFSGKLVAELNGSNDPLAAAYFSTNNKYVVTVTDSRLKKRYSFWNPATGDLLYTIDQPQYVYETLAFSPNGELMAIAGYDKDEIDIRYTADRRHYKKIKGFDDSVHLGPSLVKFLSDSTVLISSLKFVRKDERAVVIYHAYNFLKDTELYSFADTATGFSKGAMHFSHTGRYFLQEVKEDQTYAYAAELWDIREGRMIWRKPIHLISVSFSNDDTRMLKVAWSPILNVNTGQTLYPVTAEVSLTGSNAVADLRKDNTVQAPPCYSPAGNYIAAAYTEKKYNTVKGYEETVYRADVWNKNHLVTSTCFLKEQATAMAFSQDEHYLITGYSNGDFSVWDTRDTIAKEVSTSENIIDPISRLHYDSFSNRIFYATKNMYGVQPVNSLDRVSFISTGGLPVKAVHFLQRDKYSILNVGDEAFRDYLFFIANDSLSVLKKLAYHYTNGYVTIGMDTGVVDKGNRNIAVPLQRGGLGLLQVFSDGLSNNTGKKIIYPQERYSKGPPIPEVRFTYGSIQGKEGADTALLIANTAGYFPIFNKKLNSYLYAGTVINNGFFRIRKRGLQVTKMLVDKSIVSPVLSSNGRYLLGTRYYQDSVRFNGSFVYCFDLEKNRQVFKTPLVFEGDSISSENSQESLRSAVFSPDGKTAGLLSPRSNAVRMVDARSGKPLYSLTGHTAGISGIEYTVDSRFLYSWSEDGSYKKWDLQTGKALYTFIFFRDHDYAVILPDGYYYISSRTDAKYLNFKLHNRLYNFSQFDLRFNRPDKVLEAMGSSDTALISGYRKAWQNRLAKAGFTETVINESGLHVPEVLLHTDSLPAFTKERQLDLSFTLSDSLFAVTTYNIFINDVPVMGINGARLEQPVHTASISRSILLSSGSNKIEVSCANENGIESRKEALYIDYTPMDAGNPKTWFIGIGINRYSAHSSFIDLSYCVKDIRDLSAAFKAKFKEDIFIDTLINDNASKENILALRQKLLQTGVDDRVIISFSGHGMVDPANPGDFYFVTGNTQLSNPAENGISYAQLEELLDSIPARKKLLLLDACHSGESDDNLVRSGNNIPGTKRGAGDGGNDKKMAGSIEILDIVDEKRPASATDIFKLMKEAFVDIRRNNGAYVLSAAQSNEVAGEGGGISNGWFTSCLIEQLRGKNSLSINELSMLVNKCVNEKSGGNQNTDNRQELAEFNWRLW